MYVKLLVSNHFMYLNLLNSSYFALELSDKSIILMSLQII